jgi:hypothetical protein
MITFQGRTPINHHQTQKQNQKNKINKIIKKRNENVMLLLPEKDVGGPDLDGNYVEQKTKPNRQQRMLQEENRSHKTTSV